MVDVYNIATSFEEGETLYVHDVGDKLLVGPPYLVRGRRKSQVALGVAIEPIFCFGTDSRYGLCVQGPEIRLYSYREERAGPVVGFLQSYKGDSRTKVKRPSVIRRRLRKLFATDGFVVSVFIVVLLVLGFAIGMICAILTF